MSSCSESYLSSARSLLASARSSLLSLASRSTANLGGAEVDIVERNANVLLTDAEKASDANSGCNYIPFLIENDVIDVTKGLAISVLCADVKGKRRSAWPAGDQFRSQALSFYAVSRMGLMSEIPPFSRGI